MARDAIEAVKEVEEKSKTILEDAKETSKKLKQESESLAEEKYKQILLDAKVKAKELKDTAVAEGEAIAKPIIEKGMKEAEALLAMDDKNLKEAVNIIIERIVNTNGNS